MATRETEQIIKLINSNSQDIVDNISRESIDVYNFIKSQFDENNIIENYLFQFIYRSFYRIDNAGLTKEFKTEYFNILQEYRNKEIFDYSDILERLHRIPNHRGLNTFQFSFVTKMHNTINNNMPIYDSDVAEVFSFKKPKYNLNFNDKIEFYLEQLSFISNTYNLLFKNNNLDETTVLFDNTFQNHNLSREKVFDFIFWSAGKVIRKL